MTGTVLSYYLAFLIDTGAAALPAVAPVPVVDAPAPIAAPTAIVTAPAPAPAPARVIVAEDRTGLAATPSHLVIGADLTTTTAGATKVATAATAAEVVEKVQGFYAGIQQVTAKFRQEVTNATFGRSTTQDGKVWIKKPGKMRWDYYDKGKKSSKTLKSFISNGKYLYVVEHGNKQVVEKNLENNLLPVAVTFLYGKGDLSSDFNAELDTSKKYGGKGEIVLKLTPKAPSTQYKHLFLVVAADNYRVKQSIIVDSANNVNHFRFYEPDFDKTVDDKWFEFDRKSVKNYRIITDDDAKAPPASK